MSGKPRWACAACGMYSSRKYSVKRHIMNVHNGFSNIVSFIDYVAGRRQGVYLPSPIPTYLIKQQNQSVPKTQPLNIFKEELLRTAIRKKLGYP